MNKAIIKCHPNYKQLRTIYINNMDTDTGYKIESFLQEIKEIKEFNKLVKSFVILPNISHVRLGYSKYIIYAPNFEILITRSLICDNFDIKIYDDRLRTKFMMIIGEFTDDDILINELKRLHIRYNYLLGLTRIIDLPEIRYEIIKYL